MGFIAAFCLHGGLKNSIFDDQDRAMKKEKLDLSGYTAMVCGSSQGIGRAAAISLAEQGARIVLLARNEERLKGVLAELQAVNDCAHRILLADFSRPEQLASVLSAFTAEDSAHILVNNTGGPPAGTAIDAEIEAYRIAFNQHLICNQVLVQHLLPGMREKGYGRIINVISTSVKQPLPNLGVSNTIRGAVANWSKTLSRELGPHGITVNNVLPGATATARLSAIAERKAAQSGKSEEVILEAMAQEVPLRRVAEAEEVGDAIAFLASPAAAYISGINLPVDGGRTACL